MPQAFSHIGDVRTILPSSFLSGCPTSRLVNVLQHTCRIPDISNMFARIISDEYEFEAEKRDQPAQATQVARELRRIREERDAKAIRLAKARKRARSAGRSSIGRWPPKMRAQSRPRFCHQLRGEELPTQIIPGGWI